MPFFKKKKAYPSLTVFLSVDNVKIVDQSIERKGYFNIQFQFQYFKISNSLFVFEREGSPTTMTWGGGTFGLVGGRRMSQWCGLPAHHQQESCYKIFTAEADYINAFSHRLASLPSTRSSLTRRTTSMPFHTEVATGGGVLDPGHVVQTSTMW